MLHAMLNRITQFMCNVDLQCGLEYVDSDSNVDYDVCWPCWICGPRVHDCDVDGVMEMCLCGD